MLYAGLFIAVVAALAVCRRQSRRTTDLFITAPRLKLMTVRLYEDGGRQLQLYAVGDSDVPDCMWHFPRGAYVLLFHLNEPEDEEDEEYGDEVFLIGLNYRGAYRKRLDLILSPLDDGSGWRVRVCADGHPPFYNRDVPFAEATEQHPCIISF
jgi:hypothetical protein